MKKLTFMLILLATSNVMACHPASNSSKSKVSQPASSIKPVKKSENDDIHIVPNQFPLKDGVLPKKEHKDKNCKTKKIDN